MSAKWKIIRVQHVMIHYTIGYNCLQCLPHWVCLHTHTLLFMILFRLRSWRQDGRHGAPHSPVLLYDEVLYVAVFGKYISTNQLSLFQFWWVETLYILVYDHAFWWRLWPNIYILFTVCVVTSCASNTLIIILNLMVLHVLHLFIYINMMLR